MAAPVEQLMSGSAARRKLLQASVSCLCNESNFGFVEEIAIETLTEMIQSCNYCYFTPKVLDPKNTNLFC